jgi:hypothetical protein
MANDELLIPLELIVPTYKALIESALPDGYILCEDTEDKTAPAGIYWEETNWKVGWVTIEDGMAKIKNTSDIFGKKFRELLAIKNPVIIITFPDEDEDVGSIFHEGWTSF